MSCENFLPFIDAYVDQEFDERDLAEMEAHLKSCHSCRDHVDLQIRMKNEFKACLSQEKAPEALKERIFEDLDRNMRSPAFDIDEIEATTAKVKTIEDSEPSWWVRNGWIIAPLAAAVALVVFMPTLTVAPAASDQLPIVEQTVEWHRGHYPIEITGPDPAIVSQWFRNKVEFPVRLPQFADEHHANLLGGRIAHIQDRRAAYVLYEVDGTKVSVFIFDGGQLTVPNQNIRKVGGRDMLLINNKGYEVAVLQDGGVTYAIASELSEDKLLQLVANTVRPEEKSLTP